MMPAPRRLALLLPVVLVVAACAAVGSNAEPSIASTAGPTAAPRTAPSVPAAVGLTVYAAASLKTSFADIKAAYEAAHPGVTLTMSFDGSSVLEAQIEQGAPADVFASADTRNPQDLVDGGLATGPVTPFARNALTVIVPAANPAGITGPADLAKAGVKVVAAGPDVPITKYAERLIANLAMQGGYPADYAARVEANIVSREDNVAAVTSKIELGEGDAAIVYVTDARDASTVTSVPVPDTANVPATYGAVAIRASRNAEAAASLVSWLAGPDGQAILAKHGFLPPS